MNVNSSVSVSQVKFQYTSSTLSTQGVDSDGDHDGSKAGSTEAAGSQSGSNGSSATASANVQISNAGQARQAHHGPFNAQNALSRMNTSGLSADQHQDLKDILAKYNGKQMDKNSLKQLAIDLKNAGFDPKKLFAPPSADQQAGNSAKGSNVSTIA